MLGNLHLIALIWASLAFAQNDAVQEGLRAEEVENLEAERVPKPQSQTFEKEIVQDVRLRSIGELKLVNLLGPIEITAWSQDKIRVHSVKRVEAKSQVEADAVFENLSFFVREVEGQTELVTSVGRDQKIRKKLESRKAFEGKIHLKVQVPSKLSIVAWTKGDGVTVRNLRSRIELRSKTGKLDVSDWSGSRAQLFCDTCIVDLKRLNGEINLLASKGEVRADQITGGPIYLELNSGSMVISNVNADQTFVAGTGNIAATALKGAVSFNTVSGEVSLGDVDGSVQGHTESGAIRLSLRKRVVYDSTLIESESGNIRVELPVGYSGELDIVTKKYPPKIELEESNKLEGLDTRWVRGRVGRGGASMSISSHQGRVSMSRNSSRKGSAVEKAPDDQTQ